MTKRHYKPPSQRNKPWFTAIIRYDNMARLKEIAALTKAPVTQVLAGLIQREYDTLFQYSRKEGDASPTHSDNA